jgi:hypothetical protein
MVTADSATSPAILLLAQGGRKFGRFSKPAEAVPDRLLAQAHAGCGPGALIRLDAILVDEPPNRLQSLGITVRGLGEPLEGRAAEYAGGFVSCELWSTIKFVAEPHT